MGKINWEHHHEMNYVLIRHEAHKAHEAHEAQLTLMSLVNLVSLVANQDSKKHGRHNS
jgi:hypothetical protein